MKTLTLLDAVNRKFTMTENEILEVVSLLSKRCHKKTKDRLFWAVKCTTTIKSCGIIDRVHIRPKVSYCAGQDYHSEIKIVRNTILGR